MSQKWNHLAETELITGRSLQILFQHPRKLPSLRIRKPCCWIVVLGTNVGCFFFKWFLNFIYSDTLKPSKPSLAPKKKYVSKLWQYNIEKRLTRQYSQWKGVTTWSCPYLKGNEPSVDCSPEIPFWAVKYLGFSTYSWVWPWWIMTFCEERGVTLGRNKVRIRK